MARLHPVTMLDMGPSRTPPPGSGAPPFPGYGPPSGPPPVDRSSYPGQQYHQQHPHNQYAPPSGPPGHYAPPPGPPGQYHLLPDLQANMHLLPDRQATMRLPPDLQVNMHLLQVLLVISRHPPGLLLVDIRPPLVLLRLGKHPTPPTWSSPYAALTSAALWPANQGGPQPFFQYSQCNGKKKALCIGINYFGTSSELRGCINDAHNIQRFLCSHFGYRMDDIVVLTDDAQNPRQRPTRENIITAMQWLVRDAAPNDSLFFHYSGHGGQTKDLDGDEDDGYDEVIYPVDFQQNGHLVDDDMHAIMVRPLPPGCRLTAIFDSCHSGSALDLPYIYSTEGKLKEPNLVAEAGAGLKDAFSSYSRGDIGGALKSAMGLVKTATGSGKRAEEYARATRTSPADAISWSGCKDSQTSADADEAGKATGAMSYAFVTALSQNPQQSYQQLLNSLRDILRGKYSQKPQLSSSHPMDTQLMFIC
ncbi:caspase domain-containing protein [Mycena galopus ATCC 62051]|nr:caspase domain-containing protein [Mycena galopus ATCC 62051]